MGATKYQSKDTIKIQHDEPMSFTRVIHRNVGEELLTGA